MLGPHLQHMEVPRLGVELELQLQAYATAMHLRSKPCLQPMLQLQQGWILNPLSEARDWNCILIDGSVRFLTHWATIGTPFFFFLCKMAIPVGYESRGQGLNLSHICSNAGSLNALCGAGGGTCFSAVARATAVGFVTYCATEGTPDIISLLSLALMRFCDGDGLYLEISQLKTWPLFLVRFETVMLELLKISKIWGYISCVCMFICLLVL